MVDTITFADREGELYLWIDQLCIDQTDAKEKQQQIDFINQVFASGYLITVSLDGPDADWTLPGTSRPLLRTQQPTVRLDNGCWVATFVYSTLG